MWDRRAQRARILAERYPASREILRFYAGLADWQGEVARELTSPAGSGQGERLQNLRNAYPSLLDLVARTGPPALSESARELNTTQLDQLIHESWESPGNFSALEFFARAVLQPYAASFPAGLDCPWCPQPPQAGCLRPQADGLAFDLVCALCLRRRPFPRTRCPGCNESSETKLASFTAPEFPHLRLQACDTCRAYLFVVNLSLDPAAIPEVDELAGLPLDLWALERGYYKLQPNLAGI